MVNYLYLRVFHLYSILKPYFKNRYKIVATRRLSHRYIPRLSQARYKSLEQRNVFPNKGKESEQDEDKRGETDGREDWGGLGQAGWSNCE